MTCLWRALAVLLAAVSANPVLASGIEELRAALVALDRSDLGEAQRLVGIANSELGAIGGHVSALGAEARAMADTCDARLGKLHVLRGEAVQLREDSTRRLAEVRARLEVAMTDGAKAASEISAAGAVLTAQQQALSQHLAKVRELEKWFWVPFYGAYLGIRELVDHDSQRIADLSRMMGNQRGLLEDAGHRSEVERRLATHFAASISRDAVQLSLLERTEDVVQARIAALRTLADTLHDAEGYWQEVQALVSINAFAEELRFRRALERAVRRADQPVSASGLLGLDAGAATNFAGFLAALEAKLAAEDILTGLRASDCNAQADEGPGTSETCLLPRFTYFEMPASASCRFIYVNPPNCPPAVTPQGGLSRDSQPRSWASMFPGSGIDIGTAAPSLLGDNIQEGQPVMVVPQNYAGNYRRAPARPETLRDPRHADGHNFVGAARCVSDEALFLGVQPDWAACAQACDGTGPCAYWSYYSDSRYIAGSGGECWGGTDALAPDLSSEPWPAVISGGAACDAESAACKP